MRRGVIETLGGPYNSNTTEPQIWTLPNDVLGDQVFVWQTVLGGTGSFTTFTTTINARLSGAANFSVYDTSTAVGGEIRFPAGIPVDIQIVTSNVAIAAGAPTMTVLGKVR